MQLCRIGKFQSVNVFLKIELCVSKRYYLIKLGLALIALFQPTFSFQVGDIPRSSFQFDFDFERKVLAELEKETQNWAKLGLENPPQRPVESPSSSVCHFLFHI